MANKIERRFIRRRITYVPNFKRDLEDWTKRFIGRQYWRVRGLCEPEDLYQDAWILFLKLKAKYKVDEPAHFGKLFRVSFGNHLHSLASQRSYQMPIPMTNLTNVNELASAEDDGEWPAALVALGGRAPVDINLGPQLCAIRDTIRRMGHDRGNLAVRLRRLAPSCDFPRFVNPEGTTQLLALMINETIAQPRRRRA